MGSRSNSLSRGQVTRYAIGSLGTGGFATLPGLVLVYYLTDSLGVTALAAGAIVTAAKVWDVLIDPVIGGISDRALAHTGSRRRTMLIGGIGLPIAFILTFAVPAGLGPVPAALWVLVAFIFAATFFSLFQVPYIALPAELTDDYRERTRLLSWRVVLLTVAILLFGAGGPELRAMFPQDPLLGYLVMATVAAVILGFGMLTSASVAPQRPLLPVRPGASIAEHYRDGIAVLRESQPFRALLATFLLQGLATGMMLAAAQYVARWVLGDETAVTQLFVALIAPALLMAPVWKLIADRIGKERAFRLASAVFVLATLVLGAMVWMPGWWILAPVALAGSAYAGMQTLPMAMLPDVIAYDRTLRAGEGQEAKGKGGANRSGIFGGVWTAGETTGMALGGTVLTIVLAITGYLETTVGKTVEQPESAVVGIAVSFSILPAILMIASMVALARYHLREHDIVGTSA
ncbi:MAG: MFS transporter [Microbacterium sp. 69-10]|uniref:MFS transporter n=1 Tax=Microbacterium sp. 69-10 TaxID=1895783 RepID=UPI00096589F9|nr:MFS transporter [Microbacterium sp. 69-10]OJU40439.1 MAG: MFS transporter [Microbacterium sp. 69-10]